MALFGRRPKLVAVMPAIVNGLHEMGFDADEFRIESKDVGDHTEFTAVQDGLTLKGIVSTAPSGWTRVSVSPTTAVGTWQSLTVQIAPEPNGWYD